MENEITINSKTYILEEIKVKDKQWYINNTDFVYTFDNSDYEWEKDDIEHLMRNEKELYVNGIKYLLKK